MEFYIITKQLYDSVTLEYGENWPCSTYQNVSPIKIKNGIYADCYAVNSGFLDGEDTKEKYRKILIDCPIIELSDTELQDKEYII